MASRDHVLKGVEEGVCQVNHGKEAPLRRMKPGDWVVFYSPRVIFGGTEKCRCFTAIGRVRDDLVYQAVMTEDTRAFRRKVDYVQSAKVQIEPLIRDLSFIKNKRSWGYVFKFGLVEIPKQDFLAIASAMLPAHQEAI